MHKHIIDSVKEAKMKKKAPHRYAKTWREDGTQGDEEGFSFNSHK